MYKRVTKVKSEDGGNIPFDSDVNVVIVLHFKRVMQS